jgi:lysophospholipase L1-like esterase
MKNCSFVVLETIYDNEGYLKAGLHMPDGIHLNEQGYRMWIEHIETLLNDFSNAQ